MSNKDIDPQETTEWLEAFRSVARFEGKDRAKFILNQLMDMAHSDGMDLPEGVNTANTRLSAESNRLSDGMP